MLPSEAMQKGHAHNIYDALVYCYHRDWPRTISELEPMRDAYSAIRARLFFEFPLYRSGKSLSPVIDFVQSRIPIEVQIQLAINAGQ